MKIRADLLIVKKGLVSSRHEAQVLILAGQVFTPKGRVEKSSQMVDEQESIEVKEKLPFVSRGGIKLDHALKKFKIDSVNKVCLDIGASTGGFTDCLLQRGAKKVYAIDVGYGQFHFKLRNDPRIALFEKKNFRYFDTTLIEEKVDLAVIDVSFISLSKILPKAKMFLKQGGGLIALVKPQFEVSPKELKKGIVRSEDVREKVMEKVIAEAAALGLLFQGRCWSPIEGAKGNREGFVYFQCQGS